MKIMKLSKLSKVIKNPYVLSMVSEVFSIVVAFLFSVFQSRFLGAEIKGQIATINSMLGIAAIVCGFGISQAFPFFRKNNNESITSVFLNISAAMLGIYMVLFAAAAFALKLDFKYVAVLLLTPIRIYDTLLSDITLIERPNKRNSVVICANVAELLFVFFLWLFAKPTLPLGVAIIIFKDVVRAIWFTLQWRKHYSRKAGCDFRLVKQIVKFGAFPMLSVLMASLNYRLDVLMLNGQVPDAQIGVYSIGALLADRMWLIPDAMKGIMLSNLTKGKDVGEVSFVIRVCNTLCLCIVAGIILLGKPFIDLVFGAEYSGAYQITLILLAGVFPMIYYKIISAYNIGMGKQKVSFVMLTISVVLNVIANWLLIPKYGIIGAGVASVVSYLLCAVLFIAYFCKVTGIGIGKMLIINHSDVGRVMSFMKSKQNQSANEGNKEEK